MGTEREIDALASDAIASSEREIFEEAISGQSQERDESGDRSLETMGDGLEGQHESDDEEGQEDAASSEVNPEANAKGAEDEAGADGDRDAQGRFKPKGSGQQQTETAAERGLRKELTGEREKRQQVESDFAANRKDMDALKQQMALLQQQLAQRPQPQSQAQQEVRKEDVPDRWTDPDGYDRYREAQILKRVETVFQSNEQRRVRGSFDEASAKHGAQFAEAFQAANSLPEDDPGAQQLMRTIMQSPNPGERLMSWHKAQTAAREIGNDPSAYRERVMSEQREALMKDPEFRKQVLAQLQGEARAPQDAGLRTTTQLPPSLSSARGMAPSRAASIGASDAELFTDVMS